MTCERLGSHDAAIRNGARGVSCGYSCDYDRIGDGRFYGLDPLLRAADLNDRGIHLDFGNLAPSGEASDDPRMYLDLPGHPAIKG